MSAVFTAAFLEAPMSVARQAKAVTIGAVVAALYFVAGKIGLGLAFFHTSASPVWPPTGIALATFLLLGRGYWPSILLGAFLVNVTTNGGVATSAAIAVGNAVEGLIGAALVQRFAGGVRVFERPRHIFLYTLIVMLGTSVGATIGATSLALGAQARWSDFGTIWLTWWMGDMGGALVVAPLIVLWSRGLRTAWDPMQALEAGALAVVVAGSGLIVFAGAFPSEEKRYPLAFLSIPALVWAAFRFTQREAATGMALLSYVAIAGTLRGYGPFIRDDANESLLLLQAFLGVVSVLVLAVAATVSERREIEQRIRALNLELEEHVGRRTEELRAANEQLRGKVLEHARAEEELRKSEARLREAQEVGRIGSWEWDVERNVVWWSQELHRLYGLEPGGFGATYEAFLDRVHPEDRERVRGIVESAVRNREPFIFEHRIVRPDGTVLTIHARGRVLMDQSGRVVRMLGVGQDVTLQKRAEEERAQFLSEQVARQQAEEANRLKDEFLATLSHELRTPLHAITGWAQLLQEERLDAPNRLKAIETIVRNAQVQSRLISDILDLSRMDSGKLRLAIRPVQAARAVESAIDTMRPAADAKGIRLEWRAEVPALEVQGDPERLHQVICNLLSNGIKFTPTGGRVGVSLGARAGAGEIRVEDDGPGIDPDFLPHVFDRFRQRDSSSTRRHGGLGLGLAIVKGLVELQGGTVSASNCEGGGACFTITLPAAEPRARDERPSDRAAPSRGRGTAAAPLRGVRILVVEDEPDARDLLVTLLVRQGAEVRSALGAREGFKAFQETRPDLLVSDIEMPGENGYDLIARVRGLSPTQGGAVPAVALTAYVDAESARRAIRSGYQAHLPKPIQMEHLIRTLAALLSKTPTAER